MLRNSHGLPDRASGFYSTSITDYSILRLLLCSYCQTLAGDVPDLHNYSVYEEATKAYFPAHLFFSPLPLYSFSSFHIIRIHSSQMSFHPQFSSPYIVFKCKPQPHVIIKLCAPMGPCRSSVYGPVPRTNHLDYEWSTPFRASHSIATRRPKPRSLPKSLLPKNHTRTLTMTPANLDRWRSLYDFGRLLISIILSY